MVCYHTWKTGAGKLTASWKRRSRAANAWPEGKGDGPRAFMDISLEDTLLDLPCPLMTLNPHHRASTRSSTAAARRGWPRTPSSLSLFQDLLASAVIKSIPSALRRLMFVTK